jgi:hypothetical protein
MGDRQDERNAVRILGLTSADLGEVEKSIGSLSPRDARPARGRARQVGT